MRALRTLKREAKSAFTFVSERGAPLHLALAGQSILKREAKSAFTFVSERGADPPPMLARRG